MGFTAIDETWVYGTRPVVLKQHTNLNLSAGAASVLVAVILVVIKLWALGETNALSIAASLTDSALDLIVSLTGLLAIFYAARPADEDHAFGHSSAEDLAALAQALLVSVSAIVIIGTAIARLLAGSPPALMAQTQGIIAMCLSIFLTMCLVFWQRRVVNITGNKVVAADRLHYLSDLLPNVGAIIALAASAIWQIGYVDSVIAISAALFLLFNGWRIGKAAFDALMDRRADPAVLLEIEDIARNWPGIQGFHDLKTRTAGNRIFVQMHVELDGALSLREAHDIGAGLRHKILDTFPETDVIIHKDPV